MLEAEPSELEGGGTGELATHLRECSPCAEAARRITGTTRDLAIMLQPAASIAGIGTTVARRRRRYGAAALAAAASVALILLRAPGGREIALPPDTALATEPTPVISVPPGHNALVFRTRDPKITVVWYY
jgi:hypothetical protein